MSDLVACTECAAVFTREKAPSRQCPVCGNDGVEPGGINGLLTKRSWYESIGADEVAAGD